MIKRLTASILAVIGLCFVFAGCTDDDNSELVGKWIPVTAVINGTTVNYNTLDAETGQFGFEFESGGECTATLGGVTTEGKYVFNETAVDVDLGTKELKLGYEGGSLTLELNYTGTDTTIFTFSKLEEK